MRDPTVLDPQIRAYLEAENAYTEAALADTPGCRQTLYAEMKARIKEDDSSVPAPDGPFEYFVELRHRRPVSAAVPAPARRRARGDPARRQQGGRGPDATGSSAPPRTAPITAIWPMPSTRRARSSSPSSIRDLATGKDLREAMPDTRSAIVWGARQQDAVLRAPRRQPAPAVRLPPPRRHGRQVGRAGLRGEGQGLLRRRRPDPVRASFITIDAHDHQTTEVYLIDADRPESEPRLVAPREHGHEYAVEHHGDRLIITTNSDGAEDFRICEAPARRSPAWRTGARSSPHKPRPPDPGVDRLPGPPGAARARGRPAAHHHAALRRRRRARHRLRRGGLFARHVGRLRVRHHDAALHLFVDDHAGPGVRLRHGDAHAHAAQDAGGAERPRSRRLRHAPRCWRPLPTARRCRCRCSTARARRSTAPRRCSSTATAPTASPSRPASRPARLSLVDRGFVFAIAHIRGGKDKGYRWYTDGKLREEGQHLHGLHRRRRVSWRRRATPGAAASSPTAARPAAC